jgi:hypothetical protein
MLNEMISAIGINPYLYWSILIWSLVWKGFALWKSARKESKIWFIVLLVINTVGILEILYLYIFSEIKFSKKVTKNKKR